MTHAEVLSTRSARVKAARRLQRRVVRTEQERFLAEGVKALREALAGPGTVIEVFATRSATEEHADLVASVESTGSPWHLVDDVAMGMLAGTVTPQGVVTVCRSVLRPLPDVVGAAPSSGPDRRTLVLCADVRDPGNAGTIIRTADAVGATGVVLAGHSVDPFNDKVVRATVGSLFHVVLATVTEASHAVEAARDAGYRVLAADAAGETDLFDAERDGGLDGPVAWLFGNEAWGLPEALAALADARISIPIPGRAESLNLSTAAAVCLYASARAGR